jgi:hypothetical protein
MGLLILLIGVGLLITGPMMVKAGKQRPGDRVLVPVGRACLALGSGVAMIGMCWVVVAGF